MQPPKIKTPRWRGASENLKLLPGQHAESTESNGFSSTGAMRWVCTDSNGNCFFRDISQYRPKITAITHIGMNPSREYLRFRRAVIAVDAYNRFPTLGALNAQRLLAAQRAIYAAFQQPFSNEQNPWQIANRLAAAARFCDSSEFKFDQLDAMRIFFDMKFLIERRARGQ